MKTILEMLREGGSKTLDIIASQGGYSNPGEYGDVNREFGK